ncbi:MAG: DUF6174 domain-containing protein [Actinomycetota bacterium]
MRTLIALLIATTLVLAACGDDEPTPVSAGAGDDTETTDTTTAPPTTDGPEELAPEPPEPVDEAPAPEPVDPDGETAAPSGEQLEAELAAARARWAAMDTDTYRMEQSLVAQLVDEVGPFDVTVTDGLISEVNYAPSALAAGGSPPADVGVATIEEIFEAIEAAIGTADEVRVTYDAETGVPVDVWIDESFELADEERGYTVVLAIDG